MTLDVMRKTPRTKLKKIRLWTTLRQKTEHDISNLLKIDMVEKLTKDSVLAKPGTLQVYSFNGAGDVSDQLPMKPKKNAKAVSSYPFIV